MQINEIITSKSIGVYWNENPKAANMKEFLGPVLFPARKKLGLDLKQIFGKSSIPVVLRPTAFNAKPNVRDRIGAKALQYEMPFFREEMLIDERDRQEINRAKDSDDPYIKPVIDKIYDDVSDLIAGADVVPERMIMQLMSPAYGKPEIVISGDGVLYSYDYNPDGSFKKDNWKGLTGEDAWTDHENSDPLKDIEDAQDAIVQKYGVKPNGMLISRKTLRDLVSNKKIQSYILAKAAVSGGAVRMTKALVKSYLSEEMGITAFERTQMFVDESGVAKTFYPDDMVTLFPIETLGNTCYGTTPEESDLLAKPDCDVTIVNTGVAVSVTTSDKAPIITTTTVSEIVMPTFEGMDKIFVINTNIKIEEITVTSAEGSESGKTAITVSSPIEAGHTYKYKTGASVTLPAYGDSISSGYTNWNGKDEITATSGNTIVIVEVDADSKAVKVGTATVKSKA